MFKLIKGQDFNKPTRPVVTAEEAKRLGVDQVKQIGIKLPEDSDRQGTFVRYDVWDYTYAENGQNSVVMALAGVSGTVVGMLMNEDVYPGWNLVSIFTKT